jgi:hypothetical protein
MTLKELRTKYPRFLYRGFHFAHKNKVLKITFDFFVEPDIFFRPEIKIENVDKNQIKRVGEATLRNLIFHCGLAEIPTYWKATCSPGIIIEAGSLDKTQLYWWKDLLMKGMGQFFYENRINFREPNFITITCPKNSSQARQSTKIVPTNRRLKNRYLVPLAGGRDSIVTIELLKKRKKEFLAFCVNPTKETKAVLKVAGISNPILIERRIDSRLLALNQNGYLNGHTPFTSVLSFLSVLSAILFDCRHIAFSNEKSANEGNVRYLGMMVNHQYSKSSEFEKKFSAYAKKYLAKNIHYFSILRKYSDLEISKMFANYSQYFPVFSSCNRGRKLGKRWCNECPKCLFVYMTLYPFLEEKTLLKIFGENLFEKKKLFPLMKSLIGQRVPKPFECVGTKQESRKAFLLSKEKAKTRGRLPHLLCLSNI